MVLGNSALINSQRHQGPHFDAGDASFNPLVEGLIPSRPNLGRECYWTRQIWRARDRRCCGHLQEPHKWTLKQEPVCAIVSSTHAKNTALKTTMSSLSAARLVLSGCKAISLVSR